MGLGLMPAFCTTAVIGSCSNVLVDHKHTDGIDLQRFEFLHVGVESATAMATMMTTSIAGMTSVVCSSCSFDSFSSPPCTCRSHCAHVMGRGLKWSERVHLRFDL